MRANALTQRLSEDWLPTVIADGEVHIWHSPLDVTGIRFAQLANTLAPEERARADRFAFDCDRRRFTAARGFVRRALAHYLPCDPEQVSLRDVGGKPEVLRAGGANGLQFSVSHAGDLVVIAITIGRRIGVDIEAVRDLADIDAVARDIFSPREFATWESIRVHQRQEAFFHAWTRKEAYLKAIGVGLALSPKCIEVAFRPEEPARLLCVDGESWEAGQWSIVALFPTAGNVGALAVEGNTRVRQSR